jgi:uncharacterized SAM-binding protein YcdF (DUF218 family)
LTRARRRALLLALLLAAAWPPAAWAAARWLVVEAPLASADAVVVLGGSAAYAERASYAAELFAQRRAPRVLLCDDGQRGGWSQAEQRNPFFVERAARVLEDAGVPAASMEKLPRTTATTHEEATLLREYAAARGLHSLLVVTSGYHSRRALWTLERAFDGSGVRIGLAAVAPGAQTPAPAFWWLSPAGWRMVALEYLKLAYYRLRYR